MIKKRDPLWDAAYSVAAKENKSGEESDRKYPSWGLSESEKNEYDQYKASKYAENKDYYDGLSRTTTDLGTSIYSRLTDQSYMTGDLLEQLQKDIDTYSYNLRMLGIVGFDTAGALSGIHDVSAAYGQKKKVLSQFADEKAYNSAIMDGSFSYGDDKTDRQNRIRVYNDNQKRINELDQQIAAMGDGDASAFEEERDALQAQNRQYERTFKITDDSAEKYLGTSDYQKYSGKRDFNNPSASDWQKYDNRNDSSTWKYGADGKIYNVYGEEVTDGDIYHVINGEYVVNTPRNADPLGAFFAADKSGELQDAIATPVYAEDSYTKFLKDANDAAWQELTDDEIGIYYTILNTEGADAAVNYLHQMTPTTTRRYALEQQGKIQNADWRSLAAYNVLSVPMQMIGSVASGIEDAASMVGAADYNPYSKAHSFQNDANAVRSATADRINEKTDNGKFLGITLGDVYQFGMSAVDSAGGAATMGNAYTVLMGMGAASNKAKELYDRGASEGQIITNSLISGVIEIATEYISIDKLVKMKDTKAVSELLKNILVQSGIEASEEFFGELADTAADAIIMGSQSEYEQGVQALMKEKGISREKAALEYVGENVWKATAGGFLSGGLSAGVMSTAGYAVQAPQMRQIGQDIIDNGGADALRQLAYDVAGAENMEKSTSRDISKQADMIGKKQTAQRVGYLSQMVDSARGEQNISDIAETLIKEGMSKRAANKAAETIVAFHEDGYSAETADKYSRLLDSNRKVASVAESFYGENSDSSVAKNNLQHRIARTGLASYKDMNAVSSTAESKIESVKQTFKASDNGGNVIADTGEKITDMKVESVKNGKMTMRVTLEDGKTKTVDASKIDYASQDKATIYGYLAENNMVAGAVQTLVDNYTGKSDADLKTYLLGVEEAYQYGYYGRAMQNLQFAQDLAPNQRTAAFRAGQIAAQMDLGEENARVKRSQAQAAIRQKGHRTDGRVSFEGDQKSFENLSQRQQATVDLAQQMAKVFGNHYHFFVSQTVDGKHMLNGKEVENGWYDTRSGDIWIDLNAGAKGEGLALFTLTHELTHFIRQWAPSQFRALSAALVTAYEGKNIPISQLVRSQQELARKHGRRLSYDEAWEEVVANSMEGITQDGRLYEVAMQLKQENRTLWQKVKDWFADILARLKKAYAGLTPDSREANLMLQMTDQIEAMQKAWAEGLNTASQNFKSANGTMQSEKNTATEGGEVKYSVAIPDGTVAATEEEAKKLPLADHRNVLRFQNAVTEVLYGTMESGKAVFAGMPTELLAKYLKSDKGLYIPQSAIRKMTFGKDIKGGKHGFGRVVADELLYQLADPMAITGNTTQHVEAGDNSIVVWTNWMTKAGDSIIVPIRIDANGAFNNINTAFDVYNEQYVEDLLRDGNILYTKENRNIQELLSSGRQVPEAKQSDVSTDSISNPSEKSNPSDEKNISGHKQSARQEESYSTKSILTQLNAETVSQLDADGKKLLQSYQRMAKRADYYRDQIDQLRAEKNAWKGKSIHAGSVLNSALASKNAEINELQRKLENTEKIMAGQVRNPQIAKLVNTARDQAVKQLREEKNAKIDRIRQEKNAQIDRVRTQYQTSIANAREGRAVTELRGKIRRVAEDIKGRITAPSDARYIPLGLAQSVVDLSDVLDYAPAEGTKARAKYDSVSEAVRAVADEYRKLAKDDDYAFSSEFDEVLHEQIGTVAETLKGRNIRELTKSELQQVYDAVKIVRDTLRSATKLIGVNGAQDVYEAADSVVAQQENIQKLAEYRGKANKLLHDLLHRSNLDGISFMRAVEMLSGWDKKSTLYQLVAAIEDGKEVSYDYVMKYNKLFQFLKTGKNEKIYHDATNKRMDIGIKDTDGKPVLMTEMQMMQTIMTWDREARNDKLAHMQETGIKVRNANLIQDGKVEEASKTAQLVKVTPEMISDMRSRLTEWDKQFMVKIRNYFKGETTAVNDVMYQLKHRILQAEEFYIPEVVDSNYLIAELGKDDTFNIFVKEPGATNVLKTRAKQPIIIDGLETVMSKHVTDMGNYVGMAIPIRNFAKVFNGMNLNDDKPMSVKDSISKSFGDHANEVLMQGMRDVQGGRSQTRIDRLSRKMTGLYSAFNKLALVGKAGVTIKQAASYQSAGSIVSRRALILGNRAFVNNTDQSHSFGLISQIFMRPNGKTAQRLFNEIDQHTPLHYQRRLGMSMQEIAFEKLRSTKSKRFLQGVGASLEQNKLGSFVRSTGEWLNPVNWIQRMDVATTGALWVACKYQAKLDGYEIGSDEFWTHTTDLYKRVIRETQPMYDSLHRAEVQKGEGFTKYLFPFKTVPFQNKGQIFSAIGAYATALKTGTKAETKAAAKYAYNTVAANVRSAMIFAALSLVAGAVQHKMKRYRDDDDELTLSSVGETYFGDFLGVLASNVSPLFGNEIIEFISGRIDHARDEDDSWAYDLFQVGMLDLINDTYESLVAFTDGAIDLFSGDMAFGDFANVASSAIMQFAAFFGIPAQNVADLFSAVSLHVQDTKGDGFLSFSSDKPQTKKSNSAFLYEAMVSGNASDIEKYSAQFDTEKKLHNAIRDQLKKNDARITDAAVALNNGNVAEYERIINEIVGEGHFDQDDVVSAIRSQKDSIKNAIAKVYDMFFGDGTEEATAKKMYSTEDYINAATGGQAASANNAKEYLISDYMDKGATREEAEKKFYSSVCSEITKRYKNDGNPSDQNYINLYIQYGGMSEQKAADKVKELSFSRKNPDYDWSVPTIDLYYDNAQPAGISMQVFDNFITTYNRTEPDYDENGKAVRYSKMYKVAEYIEALDIPKEQKETLFLCEYSKESLKKVRFT